MLIPFGHVNTGSEQQWRSEGRGLLVYGLYVFLGRGFMAGESIGIVPIAWPNRSRAEWGLATSCPVADDKTVVATTGAAYWKRVGI